MFFVQEPHYARRSHYRSHPVQHPLDGLNEMCLLNNLQRQYAYRQQQYEKKQIQKLNQPDLKLQQDLDNYYVVLNKKVNSANHQYINKFTGNYSLKKVDQSLIIRSTRDNFYKNLELPSNVDDAKDMQYEVSNDGYRLVISIPKRVYQRQQIKTTAFGLPDILNTLTLCAGLNDAGAGKKVQVPIVDDEFSTTDDELEEEDDDDSANLYLCQDSRERGESRQEEDRCERRGETEREGEETTTATRSEIESTEGESRRVSRQGSQVPDVSESVIVGRESEESVNGGAGTDNEQSEQETESEPEQEPERVVPDFMKNYNTIKRNTVFLPNTSIDDDSMDVDEPVVPVKRTKSPTLEEVVDAEFL